MLGSPLSQRDVGLCTFAVDAGLFTESLELAHTGKRRCNGMNLDWQCCRAGLGEHGTDDAAITVSEDFHASNVGIFGLNLADGLLEVLQPGRGALIPVPAKPVDVCFGFGELVQGRHPFVAAAFVAMNGKHDLV